MNHAHGKRNKSRRAVTLVLAAFLMVVMIGLVAFGVDVGRITLTRTQLQVAADASALAQPVPDESLRAIFPTVGVMAVSAATSHIAVHCGQLAAWRNLAGFPSALGI